MSFVREQMIKATRKRHLCNACDKWIEMGEAAVNWCGMTDGDFTSVHYHPDCRIAEVAFNELHDWYDWQRLCEAESDDYPWLKAEHPQPYRRMMMTREQWSARAALNPSDGDSQ